MPELYKQADPDARRRAIIYLVIAALFGVGVIHLYRELLASAADDPELAFERLSLIVGSLYVFVLPAIWFAFRMWRVARMTREAGSWPPPELPVIRDTRIITGDDATRRALAAQIVALLVVVTSVLLPTVLLMLIRAVADRALEVGA